MSDNRIIELIKKPELLTFSDKDCIEQEIEKYPFASSFRILYLKWKQLFSQEGLSNDIEGISVYLTHREVLHEISTIELKEVNEENTAFVSEEEEINENIVENKEGTYLEKPVTLEEENIDKLESVQEEKEVDENLIEVEETPLIEEKEEKKEEEFAKEGNKTEKKSYINKLGISHLFSKEIIEEAEEIKSNNEELSEKLVETEEESQIEVGKEVNEELLLKEDKEAGSEVQVSDLEKEVKEIIIETVGDSETTDNKEEFNTEELEGPEEEADKEETITPIERMTFNDWISLSSKKVSINLKNEIPTQEKQKNIIEKFIENNPKISTPKKEVKTKTDIEFKKEEIKDIANLMTTTLAQLYVEQGKYDTAITAFKILSLKYPEKSSYFASEIRKIKKIKNSK